jgi:isocitrate dehydrogenase
MHILQVQHQLIDDMVAYALKSEGEYVWACNMKIATKATNDAEAEENGRFNFGQQSGTRDGDEIGNGSTNGTVIKR